MTYHELLDLKLGLFLPEGRLTLVVKRIFLVFKSLDCRLTLLGGKTCRFSIKLASVIIFFSDHALQVDPLTRPLLSRSRCDHTVNILAEVVNCKRVMPLVAILPIEGTLALLLLPKHLEHVPLVDKVEAVVNCLQRDSLSAHSRLIKERLRLPGDKGEDTVSYLCAASVLLTYCFISALS